MTSAWPRRARAVPWIRSREQMTSTPAQAEHEGRGYVQSNDVVNEGFTQEGTSHIVVQVVYDEPAMLDDYEGVDITTLTRELSPKNPFALNLMRITVDGEPIDDPNRSSRTSSAAPTSRWSTPTSCSSSTTCSRAPRLSVSAWPTTVSMAELSGEFAERDAAEPVTQRHAEEQQLASSSSRCAGRRRREVTRRAASRRSSSKSIPVSQALQLVANAARRSRPGRAGRRAGAACAAVVRHAGALPDVRRTTRAFIDRSEVRIFQADQSTQAVPMKVLPVDAAGFAEWEPTAEQTTAPMRELQYVLRAYDKNGNFDETNPQPLWLVLDDGTRTDVPPQDALAQPPNELLASYGANGLTVSQHSAGQRHDQGARRQHSCRITASASRASRCRSIRIGNFLAEEILPAGMHTVEVAVLDEAGNGAMFLRDLEFEQQRLVLRRHGRRDARRDAHERSGRAPAGRERAVRLRLVARRPPRVLRERQVQRGLALERERRHARRPGRRAVQQLPQQVARLAVPAHRSGLSLPDVRRRLGRGGSRADARQVLREAGARREPRDVGQLQDQLRGQRARARRPRPVRRQPALSSRKATTSFGEQRFSIDGFAAEPGTLASREEFRGTGGSLYFLRNQDILVGSERVRIELRDKDSGLVTRRRESAAGARLRHRLPAGPHRARRAAELDRRRRLARAQRRAQRR